MAMMETAFDAAGQEANEPCVIVAGFISSADDWIGFDDHWRKRLEIEGLPYFRMSDFANFRGLFSVREDWPEPRRRALLGDLVDVIQRHAYRKFGCAVVSEEFRAIDSATRDRFSLTAYVLAGRTVAGAVRQWATSEGMPRAPIAYVFEDGDPGKGKLIERMEHDAFPTPVFWPKKDAVRDGVEYPGFTPLQGADILAFELYLATKRLEANRWAFLEFARSPPGPLTMYSVTNLQELEAMCQRISDSPNALII